MVVHYMLIILQRHYFIKWNKRKVPGFKESYCYSSVLSYFAYGKTRLRCKTLTLNNKYTKKYIITLKCFQLVIYVYSCWWEIPVWSIPNFPKSQNMLSYYLKMLIRFYPSWEVGTFTQKTWGKKCLTCYFLFQKNIEFIQSDCPECR